MISHRVCMVLAFVIDMKKKFQNLHSIQPLKVPNPCHDLKQTLQNPKTMNPSSKIFTFERLHTEPPDRKLFSAREAPRKRGHLEVYFTAMYYMGICPFRPQWSDHSMTLQKNRLQQGICMCAHFGAILYQCKDVMDNCLQEVDINPVQIFTICFSVIDLVYISWGSYSLWGKQADIVTLIEITSKLQPRGMGWHKLKRGVVFTIPLLLTAFEIYVFGSIEESIWTVNDNCNIFKSHPTSPGKNAINMDVKCHWQDAILQFVIYLMFLSNLFVYNYFDAGLLFMAISAVEIARDYAISGKEFSQFAKNMENLSKVSLVSAQQFYFDKSNQLKSYFEPLNAFGAGFFFFWFCTFTPWMSLHLMEVFPGVSETNAVAIVYKFTYIFYYGVIMLVSVESKRQADVFKDSIYQTILHFDPFAEQSGPFLKSIEYSLRNVSIRGGPFFHLTFPFLGSTFGAVVTYAFLALQFHINPSSQLPRSTNTSA